MDWKPELPEKKARLSREEKKALTRRELLEAAHNLFALKGFEGSTIDDIASAAGYTRGAFYSHFRNKEAIMEALISRGFDDDLEALEPMERQASAGKGIRDAYLAFGRFYVDEPSNLLWSLEFQLACLRHPELRPAYREQFRRLDGQVAGMVESVMAREGRKDAAEYRRLAPIFIVLLSSLALQNLMDPERVSMDLLGEAFDLLLKGMSDDGPGN